MSAQIRTGEGFATKQGDEPEEYTGTEDEEPPRFLEREETKKQWGDGEPAKVSDLPTRPSSQLVNQRVDAFIFHLSFSRFRAPLRRLFHAAAGSPSSQRGEADRYT